MDSHVPYVVVYCTSSDTAHPITELGHGSPQGNSAAWKGWQSEGNGKMPQVLVLRFPGNVELSQLRILSHESKIPSKVEVRLFALAGAEMESDPPSFRAVRFAKLGAVDFNNNEHSNYRSKERKTVHLKATAYFVKLLFGTPHSNAYNRDGQVGVYSIECSGRLVSLVTKHADSGLVTHVNHNNHNKNNNSGETSPWWGAVAGGVGLAKEMELVTSPQRRRPPTTTQQQQQQSPPRLQLQQLLQQQQQQAQQQVFQNPSSIGHSPPKTPMLDIVSSGGELPAFRSVRIIEFEDFFIRRSEELLALKEQAIAVEDYDIAKQCRDRMTLMNRYSKRIYKLEQDKVQAIIQENFDAAKEAKRLMDTLIDKVYEEAQLPKPRHDFDPYACSSESKDSLEVRPLSKPPPTAHHEMQEDGNRNEAGENEPRRGSIHTGDGDEDISMPIVSKFAQRVAQLVHELNNDIDAIDLSDLDIYNNNEEGEKWDYTTAVGGGDPTLPEQEIVDLSRLPAWEGQMASVISSMDDGGGPPAPLPPGARNTREAMDLLAAVGTYTTACLFSRRTKLREAALECITDHMECIDAVRPSLVEEAVLRFLDVNGRGLQDSVPNVVATACGFVRMVLADEHECLGAVLAPVVNLLPRLLCCAAADHPRVREEAVTTLTLCVRTGAITKPTLLTAVLAEPMDRERRRVPAASPRAQLARLGLLEQLIASGRLALRGSVDALWTRLLLPCVRHPNREVREAAVATLTLLVRDGKVNLPPSRLGEIDNPALREQLAAVVPPPSSRGTERGSGNAPAAATAVMEIPTQEVKPRGGLAGEGRKNAPTRTTGTEKGSGGDRGMALGRGKQNGRGVKSDGK